MTDDALSIFQAALRAADPVEAIRRHAELVRSAVGEARKVYVVGAGKAGASMALAVEQFAGDRIAESWINVKDGHTLPLERIRLHECGHPVPDERGTRGAEQILRIARDAGEGDLVICLISGGASALAPLPAAPVALADKQQTTKLLLACGATIHEINTVRKHISAIKGGQLAAAAAPARVLSLILSDVIGDNLDVIGSGMTAPDTSTFADAEAVLRRYGIFDSVPASVRERLRAGAPETPTSVPNTENVIVGSNRLALDAAAHEARRLGYHTLILSSTIDGETRDVARVHAAIAREIHATGHPIAAPACVVSGGETTVTLRGSGKGGRNQEFALAAAIALEGAEGVVVLSGGTDGTDGPTDAAGAIASGETVARGKEKGLVAQAFLDNNDSYRFFDEVGGLIRTGPTNTNVMDVRILLVGRD